MGFASAYEVWVSPICRDIVPFTIALVGWIATQLILTRVLPHVMPGFRRLSQAQKEDLIIRGVSIVNGCVMSGSAVVFLRHLHRSGWRLPQDQYEVLPEYRLLRISIVAYFTWDVIICFYYKWSFAWKVHGLCSLVGTYMLAFPFADGCAGYYTGCFELSNAFLHTATVLRTLSSVSDPKRDRQLIATLDRSATRCEYIFGLLFFLIRVVGGTYVTWSWTTGVGRMLLADIRHRGQAGYQPQLHDEFAIVVSISMISLVQVLQYVWFVEVIRRAFGSRETSEPKEDAKEKVA